MPLLADVCQASKACNIQSTAETVGCYKLRHKNNACGQYKIFRHAHSSIVLLSSDLPSSTSRQRLHIIPTSSWPSKHHSAMPLYSDYLDVFNKNWQCSECLSDYSGQEPSKPWQTSDGISHSLVCEDCLSRAFDKALQYYGCFPLCFRGIELDPHHFQSILLPNYINQYSGRSAGISAQRASAQAHFPELLRWGVDYQICPGCKSAACLEDEDGYRQLVCVCCLTSFCFRCGEVAEDVDELDLPLADKGIESIPLKLGRGLGLESEHSSRFLCSA